jgi:hypothetical protein
MTKDKTIFVYHCFFMKSFICSHANSNINDDISHQNNDLIGLNIAITAEPTHEIIDSARICGYLKEITDVDIKLP